MEALIMICITLFATTMLAYFKYYFYKKSVNQAWRDYNLRLINMQQFESKLFEIK
jgi:hypothetical protein